VRFGESTPHRLPVAGIEAVGPDRSPGVFLGMPRAASRLESGAAQ
jgi:hypothetical protein